MGLVSLGDILMLMKGLHNLDVHVAEGIDAVKAIQSIDFKQQNSFSSIADGAGLHGCQIRLLPDITPIVSGSKDWEDVKKVLDFLKEDSSCPIFRDDMTEEDEIIFRRKFFEASQSLWMNSPQRYFIPRSPLFNGGNHHNEVLDGIGVVPLHGGLINRLKKEAWRQVRERFIRELDYHIGVESGDFFVGGARAYHFDQRIELNFGLVCFVLAVGGWLVIADDDSEPHKIDRNVSLKSIACDEVGNFSGTLKVIEEYRENHGYCLGVGMRYIKEKIGLSQQVAMVAGPHLSDDWQLKKKLGRHSDPFRSAVYALLVEAKNRKESQPSEADVINKLKSEKRMDLFFENNVLMQVVTKKKADGEPTPVPVGRFREVIEEFVKVHPPSA